MSKALKRTAAASCGGLALSAEGVRTKSTLKAHTSYGTESFYRRARTVFARAHPRRDILGLLPPTQHATPSGLPLPACGDESIARIGHTPAPVTSRRRRRAAQVSATRNRTPRTYEGHSPLQDPADPRSPVPAAGVHSAAGCRVVSGYTPRLSPRISTPASPPPLEGTSPIPSPASASHHAHRAGDLSPAPPSPCCAAARAHRLYFLYRPHHRLTAPGAPWRRSPAARLPHYPLLQTATAIQVLALPGTRRAHRRQTRYLRTPSLPRHSGRSLPASLGSPAPRARAQPHAHTSSVRLSAVQLLPPHRSIHASPPWQSTPPLRTGAPTSSYHQPTLHAQEAPSPVPPRRRTDTPLRPAPLYQASRTPEDIAPPLHEHARLPPLFALLPRLHVRSTPPPLVLLYHVRTHAYTTHSHARCPPLHAINARRAIEAGSPYRPLHHVPPRARKPQTSSRRPSTNEYARLPLPQTSPPIHARARLLFCRWSHTPCAVASPAAAIHPRACPPLPSTAPHRRTEGGRCVRRTLQVQAAASPADDRPADPRTRTSPPLPLLVCQPRSNDTTPAIESAIILSRGARAPLATTPPSSRAVRKLPPPRVARIRLPPPAQAAASSAKRKPPTPRVARGHHRCPSFSRAFPLPHDGMHIRKGAAAAFPACASRIHTQQALRNRRPQ
ncbi:hypothetical protein DFH06DRAFT_1335003 [Mycena polygramma]|nr:hypothetical protein DFH06DRAFT_1335003 [Mycena polygramma]